MARPIDILTEEQIRDLEPELSAKADKELPGEWYQEYVRSREVLNKVRRWSIRNGLFRGFAAERLEIKPGDNDKWLEVIRQAKKDHNLTDAEFTAMVDAAKRGLPVYTYDRTSNPARRHPDSEINFFLDLTEQYNSLAEIPKDTYDKMKEWMLEAKENDTMLIQHSIRNTARVMKNPPAEKTLEMENSGATLEELIPVISGLKEKELMETGNIEAGIIHCGQVVGVIDQVKSIKEIIDDMVNGAQEVGGRLKGLGVFS